MTKNILLAATAVSVMAFAGAASAHTITFRTTVAADTQIGTYSVTNAGAAATDGFSLAAEAKTPTTNNVFWLTDSLSSGNLPSGNVVLTITLTGDGEFNSAPTAANVVGGAGCTTFTAVPSVAPTAKVATFIISNSLPNCSSFNMNLDLIVTGAGGVGITTNLVTDGLGGSPIDGGSASRTLVVRENAFQLVVDASITGTPVLGAAAGGRTQATLNSSPNPAYTRFNNTGVPFHSGTDGESATVGLLGHMGVRVNEASHYNLLPANLVDETHVTAARVAVVGDYSALTPTLDGTGGPITATVTGDTAVFGGAAGTAGVAAMLRYDLPSNVTDGAGFIVTKSGSAAIPSSPYMATVTYTLDTMYNADTISNPNALEPITRDGTNVIFPWMNSTSIQNANGSTNLIRLGNVSGTAAGAVFAQVLNTVPALQGTGYVAKTAPVKLFDDIAARGERVVNTALLTTELGDFGRGDIQISIEARPEQITARRYATLANGSVTEFESGTVANDQSVGGATVVFVP